MHLPNTFEHLHLQNRAWAKSLEDFLAMKAMGDDSLHVRLHLVTLWRALGQDEAADDGPAQA